MKIVPLFPWIIFMLLKKRFFHSDWFGLKSVRARIGGGKFGFGLENSNPSHPCCICDKKKMTFLYSALLVLKWIHLTFVLLIQLSVYHKSHVTHSRQLGDPKMKENRQKKKHLVFDNPNYVFSNEMNWFKKKVYRYNKQK